MIVRSTILALLLAAATLAASGLYKPAHGRAQQALQQQVPLTGQPHPLLGRPIPTATLVAWRSTGHIGFTELPPTPTSVGSLQAIRSALAFNSAPNTPSLSSPYISVVRFGKMTDYDWRNGSGLILNHRLVWVVIYARYPIPITCPPAAPGTPSRCTGSGQVGDLNVVIDAKTGKYVFAFSIGRNPARERSAVRAGVDGVLPFTLLVYAVRLPRSSSRDGAIRMGRGDS